MGNCSTIYTGSLKGLLELKVTPELLCVDKDPDEMPERLEPFAKRLPAPLKDLLAMVDSAIADWKTANMTRSFLEDLLYNIEEDNAGLLERGETFERSQQCGVFWVEDQPPVPPAATILKWGPTYGDRRCPGVPSEVQKRSGPSALSSYGTYAFGMQDMRQAMGYIINHPARKAPGYNEELLQYVIGALATAIGSGEKMGHDVLIMSVQG
jgi:hypothetical protein